MPLGATIATAAQASPAQALPLSVGGAESAVVVASSGGGGALSAVASTGIGLVSGDPRPSMGGTEASAGGSDASADGSQATSPLASTAPTLRSSRPRPPAPALAARAIPVVAATREPS